MLGVLPVAGKRTGSEPVTAVCGRMGGRAEKGKGEKIRMTVIE